MDEIENPFISITQKKGPLQYVCTAKLNFFGFVGE
jgi:hypothetical protein